MIRALLLDLDNTLLKSDLDRFISTYLDLLANHFRGTGPKDHFIALMMAATREMVDDLDPTRTLKETFDRAFYPGLGLEETDLREETARFYEEVYPQLSELTEPAPGAMDLIQEATDEGLELVIATNPLFPMRAIEHRLQWAGVNPGHPGIRLITGYEGMHFAKPHGEYYAEVLGMLGIHPSEAAMVGDDMEGDILPADLLGMATLYRPGGQGAQPSSHLAGIVEWTREAASVQAEGQTGIEPRAILARLRADLSVVLTLTEDLESDSAWRWRPSKSAWAAVEILCHLRDVDREVNQPRVAKVLSEEIAFLSAANPDSWAEPRRYIDQIPDQALEEFVHSRLELIAQLATLESEQWQRPARHALLGPTTLAEILGVAVDHDLLHLEQLRETLTAYREEITAA